MATRREIVVTLDGVLLAPDRPIVGADDPMFSRGDGVFETVLLRDGRACLLEAHLERLGRSAAIVGLPAPDLDRWRSAADTACAQWADPADAVLRLVCGRATGVVTVSELPGRVLVSRRDGVSAVTLDRGVTVGDDVSAPWSVAGVKSLSYAANAAALRQAERLGAGDAVFLSADGVVLEGPRSSVVIVDARGVLVTPLTSLPILPGTTVRALFEAATARGLACEERSLRVADLLAAHGVWLLSSVTLAARVHTLDGMALAPVAPTPNMAALVDDSIAATL